MSTEFRYHLDKKSVKFNCPACDKKKYTRYVDTHSGDYIPFEFGICDRIQHCQYHSDPYKSGYAQMVRKEERGDNPNNWEARKKYRPRPVKKSPPVFIPIEVLRHTLKPEGYQQNIFIQNLLHHVAYPFDQVDIAKVIELYALGTIAKGYRAGAITFPFIDEVGNVRAIQVKEFDETNHTKKKGTDFLPSIMERYFKRRRDVETPSWVVSYQSQDLKLSCLFGAHILAKYPDNPIALTEAPKTAVYGSLYFGFPDNPDNFLWLAVYNLSSLKYDKLKCLAGRRVVLFPDSNDDGRAYNDWGHKLKSINARISGPDFIISDLLNEMASETEKNNYGDLADVLINQDWRKFRPKK